MADSTIHDLIRAMTGQIQSRPDVAVLRAIRDRIDTRAFRSEVAEHARGINDPARFDAFYDDLKALRRRVEERRAALDYDRSQLNIIGIGGGVALVGGSIIAAVSIAVPPLALFPCFGGLWMAVTGYGRGKQLNAEIALCDQIVDRLRELDND